MKSNQLLLQFTPKIAHMSGKKFRDGLSSVVQIGNTIWLTCDESISIERLTNKGQGKYADHVSFNLADFFTLPVAEEKEIDIEGVEFDGDFLWLVGSHSLKRKKPKPNQPLEKQLSQLAKVEVDENRYFLAKIPVAFDAEGLPYLAQSHNKNGKELKSSYLKMKNGSNQLMKHLRKDDHFADFLIIPGKDNGFDIEGFSVANEKIYVGLRGPVLRGWACVLELNWYEKNGYIELDEDQPYYKHFLKLEGMGIRELSFHEEAMYVLAGPTMDLDGTISVFRWNLPSETGDTMTFREDVEKLLDVPHGYGDNSGRDKAEGMCFVEDKLLIVYDSPANARLVNELDVLADLFTV